jgi:hypothetical protein
MNTNTWHLIPQITSLHIQCLTNFRTHTVNLNERSLCMCRQQTPLKHWYFSTTHPSKILTFMMSSIFCDITPHSPLIINWHFRWKYHPHHQGQEISQDKTDKAELATGFMLVSYLAYSSTLKTEMTFSSETSLDFQQTTLYFTWAQA